MSMKLLDDLIQRLAGAESLEAVAREAQVSERTLRRIRDRENSPRLETVQKVLAALDKVGRARRAKPAAERREIPEVGAEARHTALGDVVIDRRSKRDGPR